MDRNGVYAVLSAVWGVALRKESVDRNYSHAGKLFDLLVALRKESVDRNPPMCTIKPMPLSRSPQGERG